MITVETDKLVEQLKQYHEDAVKAMTDMVGQFAMKLTDTVIENTPIGDADELENNPKGQYARLYKQRVQKYGIEFNVGFHSGAWRYSEDGNFTFDNQIYAQEETLGRFRQEFNSNYKLGETFYVGAEGPGFEMLEAGGSAQAPTGIMKPTVDMIVNAYKINIKL